MDTNNVCSMDLQEEYCNLDSNPPPIVDFNPNTMTSLTDHDGKLLNNDYRCRNQ